MRNSMKALACALALANGAYLGWKAMDWGSPQASPARADVAPGLLTPAAAGAASGSSAAAAQALPCVKIAGLAPAARDVAIGALGDSLGARAFAAEGEAWALESVQAYPSQPEAQAEARRRSDRAGPPFSAAPRGSAWALRVEGFRSQAEAAAAAASGAAKGMRPARSEGSYDVRFGPWPQTDLGLLAKTAAGVGAAGSGACNQQEAMEWERSRK